MISNIILGVITIGLLFFVIGSVFLTYEEKKYRYDINVTDEHEI